MGNLKAAPRLPGPGRARAFRKLQDFVGQFQDFVGKFADFGPRERYQESLSLARGPKYANFPTKS